MTKPEKPLKTNGSTVPVPKPASRSGTAYPRVRVRPPSDETDEVEGDEEFEEVPIPVALNTATLLKMILPVFILVIGAVSTVLYSMHRSSLHIENGSIHLRDGERHTFETKAEARRHRIELVGAVKREVKLEQREMLVEQRSSVQKVADELKTNQNRRFHEILTELKKGR